jgi:hypothetical protein
VQHDGPAPLPQPAGGKIACPECLASEASAL